MLATGAAGFAIDIVGGSREGISATSTGIKVDAFSQLAAEVHMEVKAKAVLMMRYLAIFPKGPLALVSQESNGEATKTS